jgi:hypothetical protein
MEFPLIHSALKSFHFAQASTRACEPNFAAMKYTGLVIAIVAACNTSVFAVRMVETKGNRIDEVVALLEKMQTQINKDGTS